ncbi:MAG: hypothetical protein Fur0043_12560 [Anaerolineales bacterium]
MNLRCMYCQTLFGISREDMLIGLRTIQTESLTHYDFHCPKCRRANRVERVKLERAYPNWQEALAAMTSEAQPTATNKEQPASPPNTAKKTTAGAKTK